MKKTLPLLASALALAAAATHAENSLTPTIGRLVHYYPGGIEDIEAGRQPRPALICNVWSDGELEAGERACINIGYLDANGSWLSATSVYLYHPESEVDPLGGFALWMPFQSRPKADAAGGAGPADVQLRKIEENGEPVAEGFDTTVASNQGEDSVGLGVGAGQQAG
jgi:hypothetical protein